MKKLLLFLFFLIDTLAGICQPTNAADTLATIPQPQRKIKLYHVNRPVVWSITGVGLFTDYFAIARIKGKTALSDAEINALRPDLINFIDKWGLQQTTAHYKTFSNYSDYWQAPVFLFPGLLAFNKNISKDWGNLLAMYLEGHTLTFTFYNYSWLGPTFHDKYRPLTYYTQLPLEDRKSGNNRNSFYSGHTASVSYSTFFMAKVYCDYKPEMKTGTKILLYSAALVPPAVESYLRIESLAHFPSDCMTGLALGAAIGIIIPELHKFHPGNLSLGIMPSPACDGMCVSATIYR